MVTKELIRDEIKEDKKYNPSLILWNDEVNSFDWVIDSLVKVLNHNKLQAEQCAYMVHHSGKCSVKSGEEKVLKVYAEKLGNLGLTVSIE
jgi:ATP-dependent Clp protease adaptor protein ClpS